MAYGDLERMEVRVTAECLAQSFPPSLQNYMDEFYLRLYEVQAHKYSTTKQTHYFMLRLKPLRSKAMLDAARGQPCVRCNKNDGTTVACHYQGIRADAFGRGKSRKAHDLCIADLCGECHTRLDNYQNSNFADPLVRRIDMSEDFMTCVIRTLIRRVRQGVLTAKGFEGRDDDG